MIPMQMGNENHTYIVWINTIPTHSNKAGHSAVDQELATAIHNQNATLEPAAASKGVTAAEKLYLNRIHETPP
jgi:hypothetical protein